MSKSLVFALATALVASYAVARGYQQDSASRSGSDAPAMPMPTLHHIHINAVNPDASIAWYQQYWPKGRKTTFGGFPAFQDGIYLLYTKVPKQAPGAFDRTAERSVPQSAFWTFGSTFVEPRQFAMIESHQMQD